MSWIHKPSILHPLTSCSWPTFLKVYFRHWPYSWRSLPARTVSWMGMVARTPFTAIEELKFGKAIRHHELSDPPVFIVGHWRSGTTFLHNILSKSQRFGTISFSQTAMPLDCMGKWKPAKKLIQAVMP